MCIRDRNVTNVNDNPPCPVQTSLEATISENTLSQLPLLTIELTDIDNLPHSSLEFTAVGQYSSDFNITSNGDLYIARRQDREDGPYIIVSIQASDGPLFCPYLSNITIYITDENDNAPVVSPQTLNVSVKENSPELQIYTFTAVDADVSPEFASIGKFEVEAVLPEDENPLQFDITNSGVLRATRSLDAEGDPTMFVLHVFALDSFGLKSQPAIVTVHVENVNDHQPEFLQERYYVAVGEDTPPNTIVLDVAAVDRDIGVFGEVSYSLVEVGIPFSVHPSNGSIYSIRAFDFENDEQNTFSFTVVATDGGGFMATTLVRIDIGDLDEFAPVIEQKNYSTCIDEGTQLGLVLLTLTATDKDSSDAGNITFASRNVDLVPFEVLPDGTVRTSDFVTDYESGPSSYSLYVVAIDSVGRTSEPAVVEVCIRNVNDERPFFVENEMELSIEENRVGFIVNLVADDPDGSVTELRYTIISEPLDFRLFPNGSLYLEEPFDFEQEISQLNLQVVANDSKYESNILNIAVSVTNINDHPPMFSQTSFTVDVHENEPSNTIIAIIPASDGDAFLQGTCLLYTSPSPRDATLPRMPSSA